MKANCLEPTVETSEEVEDERAVLNGLVEVTKSICHALELPAVGGDVLIALLEVAELRIEMEGASLAIPAKLGLDGEP